MPNHNATDFLRTAIDTAEFFGFRSIDELKKDPACKNCKRLPTSDSAADRKQDALSGMLTSGLNMYTAARFNGIEGPTLFYTAESVPRTGEVALAFHVFDVEKSIAEAILIQSVRSLMLELGYDNHTVRVNSIGDQDSLNRYVRELTNYLRKRIDHMSPAARELMKEHTLSALTHLLAEEHELGLKSPSPLEYLSDNSRKHFREIVEYLDMSETPYEIDPKLLGHHQCYSDAMFTIDIHDETGATPEQSPIYARGGRYSEFVYRSTKQRTPAAGAVVVLRDKKAPVRAPKPSITEEPSVYVVQLGFGPKIKSLLLVDALRKAGIKVHQNLACDSLSTQLRDAENRGVRHTVIIGQKEFVEDGVILRDMHARNQENVPISQIVNRLKRTAVFK